jgi:hypothetical protein
VAVEVDPPALPVVVVLLQAMRARRHQGHLVVLVALELKSHLQPPAFIMAEVAEVVRPQGEHLVRVD